MSPAETLARQFIQIGDRQVELPHGVSVADWALERIRTQNPCIRSYLGSIRLLEEALESNYALLHCSSRRLLQIWRKVRRVCRLMQTELAPTLEAPSHVPALETARRNAYYAFQVLTTTVIRDIEAYPYRISETDLPAVRRLLCLSIGRIYSFLRDTFGEIVATDPRSLHDSDYYLSRRFPQDIDEAEWLYATVDQLNRYLQGLGKLWIDQFGPLKNQMSADGMIPSLAAWAESAAFLDLLTEGLVAKLREVLALAGIRYDEMEPIDTYSFEIPHSCKSLIEAYGIARTSIDRLKSNRADSAEGQRQGLEDLITIHEVASNHMLELMTRIERAIRDLAAYVPLWLDSIEKRRALMLTKNPDETPPLPIDFGRKNA
ncbi:MAG: hypothetical protein OES47_00530 [Acidobacteriota bacterium]|nr:hypothetical protein [Acidobacteriota bacterium]